MIIKIYFIYQFFILIFEFIIIFLIDLHKQINLIIFYLHLEYCCK